MDPAPDVRRLIGKLAARSGVTAMNLNSARLLKLSRTRRARQDRREAAALWVRLKR